MICAHVFGRDCQIAFADGGQAGVISCVPQVSRRQDVLVWIFANRIARMPARLTYFPGSPFARMCRVLIMELDLPVDLVEYEFPPGPEMFEINPLGQVPALILDRGTIFPTFLILEELWDIAGQPKVYVPHRDRQVLMTLLQMGDAYVAACYQEWCGLRPVAHNAIGYDLGQRHLQRVSATLDWLNDTQRIPDGLSLTGIALSCICLWADARNGLDWRSRSKLGAIVEQLATRESFRRTTPVKWSYAGA